MSKISIARRGQHEVHFDSMVFRHFIFLFAAGSFLFSASFASAATIEVDTPADENSLMEGNNGKCSLREAILSADQDVKVDSCVQGSGDDLIKIPEGAYILKLPLSVASKVSFEGAGAAKTIVNGGGGGSVFDVALSGIVTISGVTVQNAVAVDDNGGGITVNGQLFLNDSIVSNNATDFAGGGIFVNGEASAQIRNTVISGNRAKGSGGGVFLLGGSRPSIIENVLISDNKAFWQGGGISNVGTLAMTNVTLSGNEAGTYGGGLSSDLSSGMIATFVNVTVVGNRADVDGDGEGLGGGVFFLAGPNVLRHALVSGNTSGKSGEGSVASDCVTFGGIPISGGGNNLIQAYDPAFCNLGTTSGNITGQDPKLDTEARQNGSPLLTRTFALLKGSPAINAGDNANCPAADQRGFARSKSAEDRCDIGAYEVVCGDGILQAFAGEKCDGESLNSTTCATLGFVSGDLTCGSSCQFDTSKCVAVAPQTENGTVSTQEQTLGSSEGSGAASSGSSGTTEQGSSSTTSTTGSPESSAESPQSGNGTGSEDQKQQEPSAPALGSGGGCSLLSR